ncbi:MAG: co-chaperone GroES [Bacteroidetes bacterium]|nr:co-chaperone GroES [Bacteroidota bacterium]
MIIIGKKILVEKLPTEEKVGGVYIPVKNRKSNEGIVVAVGQSVTEVKIGDHVRYFKGHGQPVNYQGKDCLFLNIGVLKNDVEVII